MPIPILPAAPAKQLEGCSEADLNYPAGNLSAIRKVLDRGNRNFVIEKDRASLVESNPAVKGPSNRRKRLWKMWST